MRIMVCEQPNQLQYQEADTPTPASGEALVRVRRIGICGTDMHAYRGNQPFFSYPRVLGHELSGEIEAVGDADAPFAMGSAVAVMPYMACGTCIACRQDKSNCCTQMQVLGVHRDGGMAEWIVVPYSHLFAVDGITLDHAALIEPLGIGAHAVQRAQVQAGETVLVIGAGPIGLGVMAMCKARGARVIAMDVQQARLDFCRNWAQVDETVLALEQPLEQLAALTDGDMPTAVFDATGNVHSMNAAFAYPAHGGRLVYVGLVKADISFADPEFHKRELTLLASRNATRADFEDVIALMRSQRYDFDAYITHRSSFDDAIATFESWLDPKSGVIKAMIEL